jgi:glycosyltransferase involved in cell wall biosynthesis
MNRNAETAEPSPELSARRVVWLTIPCFNDADRLGRYLPELCAQLAPLPLRVWVQVVDDGSAQENRLALEALVDRIRARCPMVRPALCLECNEGKGGAILRGWDAALENGVQEADWVGFLDADGAVPAREVARILEENAAAQRSLFAARIQMRGRTVKRRLNRHLMGRVFATLVGTMIDPGIFDSQCGFKLVPAGAYRRIRPVLEEKRFAFDVELLAALNHFGFAVEEIPVDWEDVPGSKVSPVRDAWRMFRSVRAIRRRLPAPPGGKSILAKSEDHR